MIEEKKRRDGAKRRSGKEREREREIDENLRERREKKHLRSFGT